MKITTNNHARPLRSAGEVWHEDPAGLESDHPHLVSTAQGPTDEGMREHLFKFRGSWWDLDDFTRIEKEISQTAYSADSELELKKWDGAMGTSYFDAVLVRYPFEWDGITVDYGAVVVGHATW